MNLQDTYESINVKILESYIENKQEENLQLDFKELSKPDLSHSDDKKNLAKAISGFANSDGGIIVWGIKARKNDDGVDCAQEKVIIDNVPLVVSRLNELTGRAINPIVEGVLHKGLIETENKDFAVTLIPASVSGPHMAKFGEDRYYKRSGDSFYKMEHYDIEDMFGRRKKPLLELLAVPSSVRVFGGEIRFEISLSLMNRGRGTAKAPYIKIITPAGCEWNEYGYDGNGRVGLDALYYYKSGKYAIFTSGANMVIHPSIQINVTRLSLLFKKDNLENQIKDLEIDYCTTAEDTILNHQKAMLTLVSIVDFFKKNGINVDAS